MHTLEVSSCFRLYSYASLQCNGVSVTPHCKPGTNRLMRTSNAGFRSNSITSMYGRLHSHHIFDVSKKRACKPFGFLRLRLCALATLRKATISFRLGHVERMTNERVPKIIYKRKPYATRPKGRSRLTL